MSGNISLGKLGEDASVLFLKSKGFRILERNLKLAIGEIDIVANKNATLYIFEVKTRKNTISGEPHEAVTPSKAHKLILMGEKLSLQKKYIHSKLSLGVISILMDDKNNVISIKIYDYFQ